MNHESKNSATDQLIEDVKARQSNTVWPDTLRNSRSVDEFLWKGSSNAPLVQKIGAWIFGLTFILLALAFGDIAYEQHDWPAGAFAVIFLMVGGKVCLNGLRRNADKAPSEG
jgi:hypothetical protein